MKYILSAIFISFFSVSAMAQPKSLFSISSIDRGITAFDYVVSEIERKDGFSVLNIPNFQSRSAQASRWMMCAYTELAVERKSEFWSAIYTDSSGDKVIVVFPSTNSLTDPAFAEINDLKTQPHILPVASFKGFCGLK
ncbi:MAG: hypothetical protein ACJAS1_006720 [Oleiphilaceae bacterium]|jgi:hypothetical protein